MNPFARLGEFEHHCRRRQRQRQPIFAAADLQDQWGRSVPVSGGFVQGAAAGEDR